MLTIGKIAEHTASQTDHRFWSDAGLVPPAGRSGAGDRLYDGEAIARLDLVRTLRELGLGLDVVQAVLSRASTWPGRGGPVAVLDAHIRALRLRRAVLRMVATDGITIEEMLLSQAGRLSAQERQQMIDEFVDGTFEGIDPGAPGAGIARGMRQLPAELPEDPTPEQVRAWVELAELTADSDFRQRVRTMALAGAQTPRAAKSQSAGAPRAPTPTSHPRPRTTRPSPSTPGRPWPRASPRAPAGPAGPGPDHRAGAPGEQRARMLAQLETFTDARVERYWQLLAIINGQPVPPSVVPGFEWLIAALRASQIP